MKESKCRCTGHVGNLTMQQAQALEQLKRELYEEEMFDEARMDDPMLLSFLRARKFDLVKAKEMVISAEKWRKTFGVEDLVDNFQFSERDVARKYITEYYHKTDKDGRPIFIGRLNPIADTQKLFGVVSKERLLQNYVVEYEKTITERLPACSAVRGRRIPSCCIILDWASLPMANLAHIEAYITAATEVKNERYPGTTGKVYFINMPWSVTAVWNIVKAFRFYDKACRNAGVFRGGYQKALLKQIPAENLPKELGGTCECVGGCSTSDAGPWNSNSLKAE